MTTRALDANSPEAIERDRLLAVMRDSSRPEVERMDAARKALPLCHEEVPPNEEHTVAAQSGNGLKNYLDALAKEDPETFCMLLGEVAVARV